MRVMSLKQICEATKVEVLSTLSTDFSGIGTDTRKDLSGQLFIALKGENFDAHQMLDQAVKARAAALLVHELPENFVGLKKQVTILKVPDTLQALQELGTWARRQSKAKVIGITGSNGKTTSKEFTAAIIGSAKSVHFNHGSFNNHWGVPFNLLQLPVDVDAAVVEMGMNHYGEITRLVEIAEPDIVCCTMVGRAHIEHFGTIEGIAKAKQEIYQSKASTATQVFNLDNVHTRKMFDQARSLGQAKKIFSFSELDSSADVHLQIKTMNLQSMKLAGSIAGVRGEVQVSVFGAQNLVNLMAAATLSLAAGLTPQEVWKGLEKCKTNWGRNQLVQLKSNAKMIFDAYNANPDSMQALLDNVQKLDIKGKKIGIFGEMLEMGELSEQFHQELGQQVGVCGFSEVYFLGKPVRAFESGLSKAGHKGQQQIMSEFDFSKIESLKSRLSAEDLVVVKGSRGMKLERFLPACEPLDFEPKK